MFKFLKYCAITFIASFLILSGLDAVSGHLTSSDRYVKARTVKLMGGLGSCSGEQISAPSGKNYILTAGHCKDLKGNKNSITVQMEDGKSLERAIIAEDMNSDLLLLEGLPKIRGLDIADSYEPDQHVRTFTHGHGLPTYKTEGVLVGRKDIAIALGIIGQSYSGDCKGRKYANVPIETLGGEVHVCVIAVDEMVTTAFIVPGSSGGTVANDSGELVGVVSATDGSFGYIVLLSDIRTFISGY